MKNNRIFYLILFVVCLMFTGNTAQAKATFEVKGQCEESPKATIRIKVDAQSYDGFDVYRANENGTYEYRKSLGYVPSEDDWDEDEYGEYESDWVKEKNDWVEYRTYTYVDDSALTVYKTYSYRVIAYKIVNDEKKELATRDVKVQILAPGPTITSGKRSGKSSAKLQWSKVNDADGYMIYAIQDYDAKSNYINMDLYDLSVYTLKKTITNPGTLSATMTNLMNGVTYTYRVCSYKVVNGKKVMSTFSNASSVLMNYYTCDSESYSQRVKRAFGSEKKKKKNFKTARKASKQMKTIRIKVWDYKKGKKGKKVTKTKYLTVNKKLAPSIQQMFKELYKSKEKQVIKDIGCYSYRTGEHMYGMAIDINPNENYMIDRVKGKKVIMAGSYWKPKKDPYSIPADCEFVRIMNRYGFYRGDWGDRKDYMHFSYFGT